MAKRGRIIRLGALALLASGLLLARPDQTGIGSRAADDSRAAVSAIDPKCQRTRGPIPVPRGKAAKHFRILQLESGVGCETAARIDDLRFAIQNAATEQAVYSYDRPKGGAAVEKPVKLADLVLPAGDYLLSVAGGSGAICTLAYDLAQDTGRTMEGKPVTTPTPVETKKKPRPTRKPTADPLLKEQRDIEIAIDLLVLELDGLEEDIDTLKGLLDQLDSPEVVKRYLSEITRLQKEVASVAARREELKAKAAAKGLDFEKLAGDQLGELESRPRSFRGDLSLLEDQALAQERRLEEEAERAKEAASTNADIETWLEYARTYARKNGVSLDLARLRADMQAKAGQKMPARVVFYGNLFGKYIECLVEGARKRTACKVSGRVIALTIEAEKQRLTYEYEIVRECPEKTYKDPGRGGTSFEELERWVRDACRR